MFVYYALIKVWRIILHCERYSGQSYNSNIANGTNYHVRMNAAPRKNMLLYKKLWTFWISFDGIFFSEISIDNSILQDWVTHTCVNKPCHHRLVACSLLGAKLVFEPMLACCCRINHSFLESINWSLFGRVIDISWMPHQGCPSTQQCHK